MALTKSKLKERNEQIRRQYSKEYGKGFRHSVILEKLARKWFLAESTIEQIIQGRDGRKG